MDESELDRPLILIVEDDREIRESLSELLELEGYRTAAAADGGDALNYLAKQPAPHLILLDLMMPVMNGLEFRRQQLLDRDLATIPVIVLTAGREVPLENLRPQAYLRKPVDVCVLFRTIEHLIVPSLAAEASHGIHQSFE